MLYLDTPSVHPDNSDLQIQRLMDFDLPPELEATSPPEARGLARDEVRLLVSYRSDDRIVHSQFRQLGSFLHAGDALIVNTSATMNAALQAIRADGTPVEVHLSTHLPANLWIIEVRQPHGGTTRPCYTIRPGETLRLAAGATITCHTPHNPNYRHTDSSMTDHQPRLWIASLYLPSSALGEYLTRHGKPIRYSYVQDEWPLDYYQTAYANEPGSAEMPSAGRAFTPALLTSLLAQGVQIIPLLLHTGVASLESHEPPYEEYYRVSSTSARLITTARAEGRRLMAVGTTVVRTLETVTDDQGITHPGEGWTSTIVSPERGGIRSVHALLTGFHEPQATHLAMLEALASRHHLKLAYQAALNAGYLWHEFGDLHLILP